MADQFGMPHKAGLGIIVVVVGLVLAAVAAAAGGAFVPYSLDIFASCSVPRLWVSLQTWLGPTNIFIAIHIIIMVIWKLSERKEHKEERPEEAQVVDAVKPRDPDRKPEPEVWRDIPPCPPGSRGDPLESGGKALPGRSSDNESCVTAAEEEEEDGASSGDGDSMEATWQAIMEGGASPVRRYLSKSGAWVEAGRRLERTAAAGGRKEMRNSKTSKEAAAAPPPMDAGWRRREVLVASPPTDAMWRRREVLVASPPPTDAMWRRREVLVASPPPTDAMWRRREVLVASPPPTDAGWRRREVLVAHDELNLKFEEFIRKNYEQMRLQREESRQRYLDMVNRAY